MTRAAARTGPTLVADGAPTAIATAFPIRGDAPTFGLDRPARLLGGDALAPDALPSATGLDHVRELRAFLAAACRNQSASGRDWFCMPPLILVGPEGAGRRYLARRIARLAGVPLVEAYGGDMERTVRGTAIHVGDAPVPVLAMAITRCANPIVLLTLPNGALSPSASRRLAETLDSAGGGRWLHEGFGTIFDVSRLSWIVRAPDRSPAVRLVEANGGIVLDAPMPEGVNEGLRRLSIAQQAASADGRRAPEPRLVADILEELDRCFGNGTPAADALLACANAHRGIAAEVGWVGYDPFSVVRKPIKPVPEHA